MATRTTDIGVAAATVKQGGVIAYPTEAVYGLGCDPRNEEAVHRILQIKQRVPQKGLILIASDFFQVAPFLKPVDATLKAKAMDSWPGPVTWLWPVRPDTPKWLCGEHATLAVRVTAHPLASGLCSELGTALVSTSANREGATPATDPQALEETLGELLDVILEGPLGGRDKPSQIRDLKTDQVIRQ